MRLMANKLFLMKVKGGALQYTIVFSLLILMSLSLFLMYVRLSSLEVYSSQRQSQLIENINSSVVLLENQPKLFDIQEHRIGLLEDTTYVNDIEISEWGFYDRVKITSIRGTQQLSKNFLFTDNITKNKKVPSLYLSGANQYLSVGGKTYLGNNTFLPAYGVRKSYVSGIGYNRDSLIQGDSFKAAKTLPKLNSIWEERYLNLKKRIGLLPGSTNLREIKQDSITVSFNDETLILKYSDNYRLEDTYLNGNIIITGTKIRIANTSQIHRCIVLADTIIVENRFQGEAQLFAKNYLEVGDSCVLKVPSILYLHNKHAADKIQIKSQTIFQGDVIVPFFMGDSNEALAIEEGCRMVGQVYCNGYASFEGVLFGSFYATGFRKRSRNGLYENYLVDVCIDSKRIPEEYGGISLIEKSDAKVCAEEVF